MRFLICDTEEQIRLAQELRYRVYCAEKQWIESSSCSGDAEADAFDESAVHFLAFDEDGTAVGTSRYLLGSAQRLPAEEFIDVERLGLDRTRVTEVSRLATLPSSRSHDLAVFLGLTRLMWHWGMDHAIQSWMAIADVPLYHLLSRLRIPELAVAGHVDYLGSECVPVAYDMPGTGAALYRRLGEDVTPEELHRELRSPSSP